MARRKKPQVEETAETVEETVPEAAAPEAPPAAEPEPAVEAATSDEPTSVDVPAVVEPEPPAAPEGEQLERIVESLLYASDRPLMVADLKRLLGQRDLKKIQGALETLAERRKDTGLHVVPVAGGYALRTNPESAPWVGKLLQGRPIRLSRAMLETLSIVAYRQPVTRPEIDEIRGVDCSPVLGTLLDRGLIRIIGKKEEVGRPLLYGTTPEFLRTFNLRDLNELPTLREFHELTEQERAEVDAQHPPTGAVEGAPQAGFTPHPGLPEETDENDGLLDELDQAAQAASRASGAVERPEPSGQTTS
jgi:segregation and condensation protein B